MIVIHKDLLGGDYPEDVAKLITQLKLNYVDEQDLDDFYDDSVIFGCECGCGGDTYYESLSRIWEERKEILKELLDLGYKVDGEDYGEGSDDGIDPEG